MSSKHPASYSYGLPYQQPSAQAGGQASDFNPSAYGGYSNYMMNGVAHQSQPLYSQTGVLSGINQSGSAVFPHPATAWNSIYGVPVPQTIPPLPPPLPPPPPFPISSSAQLAPPPSLPQFMPLPTSASINSFNPILTVGSAYSTGVANFPNQQRQHNNWPQSINHQAQLLPKQDATGLQRNNSRYQEDELRGNTDEPSANGFHVPNSTTSTTGTHINSKAKRASFDQTSETVKARQSPKVPVGDIPTSTGTKPKIGTPHERNQTATQILSYEPMFMDQTGNSHRRVASIPSDRKVKAAKHPVQGLSISTDLTDHTYAAGESASSANSSLTRLPGLMTPRRHDPSSESRRKKDVQSLRQKAKEFLRLMHENRYMLSDLASEGLDVDILASLYEEMGISIGLPSGASVAEGARLAHNSAMSSSKPQPASVSKNLGEVAMNGLSTGARSAAMSDVLSGHLHSSQKLVRLPEKSAGANQFRKNDDGGNATNETSSQPALERKDYIAKLLAARSRKPSLTTTTSHQNVPELSVPNSATPTDITHQQTRSSKEALNMPGGLQKLRAQEITLSPNHSTATEMDEEAVEKKKIQTALARKKMESLIAMQKATIPLVNKPLYASLLKEERDVSSTAGVDTQPLLLDSRAPESNQIASSQNPKPIAAEDRRTTSASSNQMEQSSRTSLSPINGLTHDFASKGRKRPVASDFDDGRHQSPFKAVRTMSIGERRGSLHEAMIIVASDDESGFDSDSESSIPDNTEALDQPETRSHRPSAFRDLPPLSDPSHKRADYRMASNHTVTAHATPPGVMTPRRIADLEKQEEEIQAMKRKIAELEQRKQSKLQQYQAQSAFISQPLAVTSSDSSQYRTADNKQVAADWAEFNPPIRHSRADANLPQSKVADVVAGSAREYKSPTCEGTVCTTEEVLGEQSILTQQSDSTSDTLGPGIVSNGTAAHEASGQTELSGRQALRKQNDLDLKPTTESTRTADTGESFSTRDEQSNDDDSSGHISLEDGELVFKESTDRPLSGKVDSTANSPHTQAIPYQQEVGSVALEPDGVPKKSPDREEQGISHAYKGHEESQPYQKSVTGSEPEAVDVLNDTDREADVPIMVSESMDVQNHSPSPSPQPSLADSSASSSLYATEMFTEQTDTSSPRQNIADVLEDGSDVSVGSSASSSGIYSKKEGEITTTNLLATSDVSPVVATLSESIGPPVSCPSKLPPDECVVIDDAAHRPNMNGLESDVRVDSNEAGSLINKAAHTPPIPDVFKPYESPLRLFKVYPYHPLFKETTSQGFRSLTYNHNIDPSIPLCRFEAAGGACNDVHCTDDMILVRLGTSNPCRTPEEQSQWTEGLRAVLRDLRQNHANNLDVVATEIANYRRRFVNDASKILNI